MRGRAPGPFLQAAFDGDEALRAGVEALLEVGVSAEQLEVRSAAPIADLPLPHPRSRVLVWSLVGATLGCTVALLLYALTSKAYPLPTGGMPILAGPPAVIVAWEGTALGLVLLTVAGVLIEGRLFRRPPTPGPLDSRLADGEHLIEIEIGDESDSESWAGALREHCTALEVVGSDGAPSAPAE